MKTTVTTVTRVEREERRKEIAWKCERCGHAFRSHAAATDHALLVHDAPVETVPSPLGSIAYLRDENQANAWIRTQHDCTIDWEAAGWYAPKVTGRDDDYARYQPIAEVLEDVVQQLSDLHAYETALRAVPGIHKEG